MSDDADQRSLEKDICVHIFTVSAGMVGVCLTVIGIIQIVMNVRQETTLADDFLSGDALLFLVSCLLSYWALRTRNVSRMYRVEKIADIVFLVALVIMAAVCGFVTYTIATR